MTKQEFSPSRDGHIWYQSRRFLVSATPVEEMVCEAHGFEEKDSEPLIF